MSVDAALLALDVITSLGCNPGAVVCNSVVHGRVVSITAFPTPADYANQCGGFAVRGLTIACHDRASLITLSMNIIYR